MWTVRFYGQDLLITGAADGKIKVKPLLLNYDAYFNLAYCYIACMHAADLELQDWSL